MQEESCTKVWQNSNGQNKLTLETHKHVNAGSRQNLPNCESDMQKLN